jgi:invasion protein IalB
MKSLRISLALAAALLVAPAIAQEEAAPQAPKANQPTDVKVFSDWTVRCFPGKSATPCQMIELRVAKKSGQRVLSVLLAYAPSNNATLLQISVPLGVSLQNGLVINSDTWKSPPLKFRRCDQGGCYIESAVGDDVVEQLAKATNGKMQVVAFDGKRIDLAFSLKGFTEARSAMMELARQKAGKGAEPAPAQE